MTASVCGMVSHGISTNLKGDNIKLPPRRLTVRYSGLLASHLSMRKKWSDTGSSPRDYLDETPNKVCASGTPPYQAVLPTPELSAFFVKKKECKIVQVRLAGRKHKKQRERNGLFFVLLLLTP